MLQINTVAPAVDKSAISHLFNNLDLILDNKSKILFHKKYRRIKISGINISGLYLGTYDLFLGDLLKLWEKTEWKTASRYYYSIIGTPLSDMNTSYWYNTDTKTFEQGTYFNGKEHFSGLARPALQYLQSGKTFVNPNKMISVWKTKNKTPSNLTIFDLIKKLHH